MFWLEDQQKLAEERLRIEAEQQELRSEQQRIESERQQMRSQQQEFILRQLTRKLGELEQSIFNRIEQLSMQELINLGDVLLDFNDVADLSNWLHNLTN